MHEIKFITAEFQDVPVPFSAHTAVENVHALVVSRDPTAADSPASTTWSMVGKRLNTAVLTERRMSRADRLA